MCTSPSSFQLLKKKKIWVVCASFFCDIGIREITLICGEIHHTKNYQNIPKVNLSQQKIRGSLIVFLLSIKSSFRFVQEKITITCILTNDMGRVKRICVFEHSVMTNFNCACPAIKRGQGSGFLSEGSS